MAIVRKEKTSGWTKMDNRVFEDPRISFRAKGVIALLLTKPDGWEVMTQYLINAGPDGRTAVESALKELKEVGYIVTEYPKGPQARPERPQTRGDHGRFDSSTTNVYEEPKTGWGPKTKDQVGTDADFQQRTEPQVGTDAGLPSTEEPSTEEPSTVNPRRVITELVIPLEVKTEEVKNLVPHARSSHGGEVEESEEPEEPDRLKVAEEAFDLALIALFPWMSQNKRLFHRGASTEILKSAAYEWDADAPYALAAMANRLLNRADLIRLGQSEPLRSEAAIEGFARLVAETYDRDFVWVGALKWDMREEWDTFLLTMGDFEELYGREP